MTDVTNTEAKVEMSVSAPENTPVPAPINSTICEWRSKVFFPETYSDECVQFLDEHADKGVLSRSGTFRLKDGISGATVPYELCPYRVKDILRKINAAGDLPRSAFKTPRSHRTALCNLHIYGYLSDLKDKLLMQKRRVRAQYMKRWARNNRDKLKQYSTNAVKYKMKWRDEQNMLAQLSNENV